MCFGVCQCLIAVRMLALSPKMSEQADAQQTQLHIKYRHLFVSRELDGIVPVSCVSMEKICPESDSAHLNSRHVIMDTNFPILTKLRQRIG